MTAKTKTILLVVVTVVVLWIGARLGSAVENLGAEIQGTRAALLGK